MHISGMLVISVVVFSVLRISAQAQALIEFSIARDQRVFAGSQTSPPQGTSTRDDAIASVRVGGNERSQCRPYGRASASQADAESRVVQRTSDQVVLSLRSGSYAHGGHFRTCNTCISNTCVGISGNDTYAEARGAAEGTVKIDARTPEKKFLYVVSVRATSAQGSLSVSVERPNGTKVQPLQDDPGQFALDEKTPSLVVRATAATAARNEGGCCSDERQVQGLLTVNVEPAPRISTTAKLQPFIFKGRHTTGYKEVVAIVTNDELHCTGTFVGKQTIVTAAHCVHGYLDKIKAGQFRVVFGPNIYQPEETIKVISGDYPRDKSTGYSYNPATYEDDIAILVLERAPVNLQGSTLHSGRPDWTDIQTNKRPVSIVGFGFNVLNGDRTGRGYKREAVITVDEIRNRTIYIESAEPNTCNGDSGGPTFIEAPDGTSRILAAITSLGDDAMESVCTRGLNSRADAFMGWLDSRIQ